MPSYKDEYNLNAEMLNLIVTIISVNESKVWLDKTKQNKTKQNKETFLIWSHL